MEMIRINISGKYYYLSKDSEQACNLITQLETAYQKMKYHLKNHEESKINDDLFLYVGMKTDHEALYTINKDIFDKTCNIIEKIDLIQRRIGRLNKRLNIEKADYTYLEQSEKDSIDSYREYFSNTDKVFLDTLEFKKDGRQTVVMLKGV